MVSDGFGAGDPAPIEAGICGKVLHVLSEIAVSHQTQTSGYGLQATGYMLKPEA